jgi:hypothetical protein
MGDDYTAQVLESWATAYNERYQLYDDDKLEECIDTVEGYLGDSAVPTYIRIELELIFATCIDDWYKAEDALMRCENLWKSLTDYYH